MTIKPVHATLVAGMSACAVLISVAIWWLGPSPDTWPLTMQVLATVVAWVPPFMWLVHAYGYTHQDGWEYIGNDCWTRFVEVRGLTLQVNVYRRRGTSSYRAAYMVDDPFVHGDTYVIAETEFYGDLTEVLESATLEGIATLGEWNRNVSVRGERDALYRSYYM